MRKLVLAAALGTSVLATPALARDGSIYAGIEGGVVQPSMLNLKFENINVSTDNALRIKHKRGYTVDGNVGYDFGMFRVEGEAGYQRAKLNHVEVDSTTLRQVGNFTSSNQFTTNGHGSVWSGMINGILDLGSQDSLNGFAGVGIGLARAKYNAGLIPSSPISFSGSDTRLAWQGMLGLRYPLSQMVDVGVKYRYFQTRSLKFGDFCETTCGTVPPYSLKGKYKSNSLLASVTFNFGSASPHCQRRLRD